MKPVVETSNGWVRGTLDTAPLGRSVVAFRGIPYALPPTGARRFRAPEPGTPWSGVRDATRFGPAAMQSVSSPPLIPGDLVGAVDEGCLELSVWVPADAATGGGRAVMVWIPGGGFVTGGSGVETYDGAALAASQDLVVFSVQYRLGLFGFGCFPGGETNVGLKDQLLALEWIAENAPAFGGDPDQITVFGESAGAGSILHLLASTPGPSARVRRAVLQSPGVDHTLTLDQADRVTEAVLEALDVERGDTSRLWQLPAQVLLDAQTQAQGRLLSSVGAMPFHPVVDGEFLTDAPGRAFRAPAVDLMVSWTADEMRLYPNPAVESQDGEKLARWVHRLVTGPLGPDPGTHRVRALIDFYRSAESSRGRGSDMDIWAAVQTDLLMRLPARRVALSHARSSNAGVSTFTTQFDWPAKGGEWARGAFHAIDLPFTFYTLERAGWLDFLGVDDPAPAMDLAARHMDAWGSFARTGSPGWPSYTPDGGPTLIFDTADRLADDPLAPAAAMWDDLWSAGGGTPA